jgi:hypothetical protein
MKSVDEIISIGPFFSGDTGPDLELILVWDSGGYVPLEGAYVEAVIRRWDPRRKVPIGPEISRGPCEVSSPTRGILYYRWIYGSPVSSVPQDPGWYMLQLEMTDGEGRNQLSQRAVFEVLPSR